MHKNSFGVSLRYFETPISVPDTVTLGDNEVPSDGETGASDNQRRRPHREATISVEDRIAAAITPYPRFTTWLFNKHHWSFDSHSKEDRRTLVHDVLLHKRFEPEGLRGVSTAALDDELRRWDVEDPLLSPDQNGIALRCNS
ncbi:hypothetical protein AURDEDRAFT_173139 [Auricularia subglabra TFB-10046 SS5]|nr:hypothetical protein AURDEDRAFT_173139 [Auricularia subglabra TFB-10046 SS5]